MNPHNTITALDPPHTPNRRWRCRYCGELGLIDELVGPEQKNECSYVYPPCGYCGLTPTCALDCPGILEALSAPGVVVTGSMTEGEKS